MPEYKFKKDLPIDMCSTCDFSKTTTHANWVYCYVDCSMHQTKYMQKAEDCPLQEVGEGK